MKMRPVEAEVLQADRLTDRQTDGQRDRWRDRQTWRR